MDDSETTIIAVAVVEHDRQYLIGKRPPGVPLAGYCEFPGGKVHPGVRLGIVSKMTSRSLYTPIT